MAHTISSRAYVNVVRDRCRRRPLFPQIKSAIRRPVAIAVSSAAAVRDARLFIPFPRISPFVPFPRGSGRRKEGKRKSKLPPPSPIAGSARSRVAPGDYLANAGTRMHATQQSECGNRSGEFLTLHPRAVVVSIRRR